MRMYRRGMRRLAGNTAIKIRGRSNVKKSMEIMVEEITGQAKLFELCAGELRQQAKEILGRHKGQINRVYITGCGDSYHAGIACRDIFIKYAKIHTEVYQALEFSRYICQNEVDEHALVLSISSSGKVARSTECALRAKEKGALSVGITSNASGRLAAAAQETLLVTIPDVVGLAPGTQSYVASQLALICMAAALGEAQNALTTQQADEIFDYIKQLGVAMKQTVEANFELVRKYVDAYYDEACPQKIKIFHIAGSGPNWGTAQFGSMKLLEASGFDSVPQGVEEWAHTQYFTTRPGTHVIVLAPRGESRERAMEILQAVSVMDGKKIVIGEEGDDELARCADIMLPICGMENIKEEFTPLIYPIPLELLALHISERSGVPAFEFESKPWRKAENFRQIFGSKIVPLAQCKGE